MKIKNLFKIHALFILTIFSLFNILSINAQKLNNKIKINHFLTNDKIKVLFISEPEIPMVDISVIFKAGSAYSNTPGLANITSLLLETGTKTYSENQIAENFANLGTNFDTSVNKDFATVSIRTLSKDHNLNKSLKYLNDILKNSNFPIDPFNRTKAQAIHGLQIEQQNPGDMARKEFMKTIYPSHPYGIPSQGTIKSVKKIKHEDIVNFYNKYYVKPNATIAIIGDLDINQAKKIANQISSNIHNGSKAQNLPKIKLSSKKLNSYVPFASTQTHILMGLPTITRKSDDIYALYLGNNILGGSNMSSILFSEIREKNGYAYSVYSYFSPLQEPGPFVIGMQTRNKEALNAIDLTDKILEDFVTNGPSEQEIKDTKLNVTGNFPIKTASNSAKMSYLELIGFYDMSYDYLDTFNDKIIKVTKKDIVDTFKKYIKFENLARVAVGNSEDLYKEANS